MAMQITTQNKVIDPACGTGSFLMESLRQVAKNEFPEKDEDYQLINWSNESLYGVDKNDIGVKLTRATMVAMRDGSTHVLLGDAIRANQWAHKYGNLGHELGNENAPYVHEQFTVVITNPPFGEDLKVKAADCRAVAYSI